MIKVTRGSAPAGFSARARTWLDEFLAARQADPELSAGNFWSSVRDEMNSDADVLMTRFRGKCAFCEAKMAHVSNPNIEHYRPKGRPEFEALMFRWTNWLLACTRCNQKKWKHFPLFRQRPLLLNPARDNPRDHLEFKRALVFSRTKRGEETIGMLGLRRSPLTAQRASWLCNVEGLLLLATLAQSDAIKTEGRNLLIWAMQKDAPYSAMTIAYLQDLAPLLAAPNQPHPVIQEANQLERIRVLVEQHRVEIQQLQ